jgi:hypothetical protein
MVKGGTQIWDEIVRKNIVNGLRGTPEMDVAVKPETLTSAADILLVLVIAREILRPDPRIQILAGKTLFVAEMTKLPEPCKTTPL